VTSDRRRSDRFGILSTASLIVGVAAAAATQNAVLIAGVAGLVAGAMSMAAGEYVSVSSQSDSENADLARERKELSESPDFELVSLPKSTSSVVSIETLHGKLPSN
jgi:VIT1/CCC1 family predicted Fe2+/Mn2+ transporter